MELKRLPYGGKALIRILFFALFFFPLPLLLGGLVLRKKAGTPYSLLLKWVAGIFVLFASLYFPAEIAVFRKWSLTRLCYVWAVSLVILTLLSFLILKIRGDARDLPQRTGSFLRGISPYEIAALILVLIHAYVVFRFTHSDGDDATYVAAATTSLQTNTIRIFDPQTGDRIVNWVQGDMTRIWLSPFFLFTACVCRFFSLDAAAFSHTWFPPILTLFFYGIVLLLGSSLFQKDRAKAGLFTIFVWAANVWSSYAVYTSGTFLSVRSWQGKAVFVGAAAPALLYFYLQAFKRRDELKIRDFLFLWIILISCSFFTLMGMAFAVMETALLGLMLFIAARKKRLTVLIGTALSLVVPALAFLTYTKLHQ